MEMETLIREKFTEAEATWLADVLEQILAIGAVSPETQPPPKAAPGAPEIGIRFRDVMAMKNL